LTLAADRSDDIRVHARSVLIALSLVATAALADSRPDPAVDALKQLDTGVALFKANDFNGARVAFAKSHELMPDKPNPIRWIGLTDARLGRCTDAVAELDGFLLRVAKSDPRAVEATAVRDHCREELAPKLGAIAIESTPTGASVRFDQEPEPRGTTPFEDSKLTAGEHELIIGLVGCMPYTRRVLIAPGGKMVLDVTLQPEPEPSFGPELPDLGSSSPPPDMAQAAPPPPQPTPPPPPKPVVVAPVLDSQPLADPIEAPVDHGYSVGWVSGLTIGGIVVGAALGLLIGFSIWH
jgi:hypothetical protein